MWEFLKNLKEFLALDYRSLFILASICWILLVVPINVWQSLDILNLWVQFRPWIFGIGLLASTWLVSGGVYDLAKLMIRKWNAKRELGIEGANREKLLMALSRVEKEILARYAVDDTTTLAFDFRDGIVNGMIAKGILYRASQGSNPMSHDFDVNIQGWVWEYIKIHPEFLQEITPITERRHHFNF